MQQKVGPTKQKNLNIIEPLNSIDILIIIAQEHFQWIRKYTRYRMHIRDVFNYKTKQRGYYRMSEMHNTSIFSNSLPRTQKCNLLITHNKKNY